MTFCLTLYSTDLAGKVTRITNNSVNLYTVLSKYHEFTDIFNKAKVETLVSYCSYNLQIKLENSEKLLIETINSLSTAEQEALKEFISKILVTWFIQLTSSPHETPVLFVKKKERSLCLCTNFQELNYIT